MTETSIASLDAARRYDTSAPKTERDTRIQLAACYRLVHHFGWTDMVYTHLSARVPGPEDHFLLNPFGHSFDEVTASSLVKIDLDGNPVDTVDMDVHKAGFVIHGAIHKARPDALAVLHTHTTASIAVSSMREGLLPISQHALLFHGHVGYHDYEGLSVSTDECERLADSMADNAVMFLRNHGILVVGRTIPEAFSRLFLLEQACRTQVAALSMGRELIMPGDEICLTTGQIGMGPSSPLGKHEWPALLRMLDRSGADYAA